MRCFFVTLILVLALVASCFAAFGRDAAGNAHSPTPCDQSTDCIVFANLDFTTRREGKYDIYAIRADGTALRRLTHSSGSDFSPSWSPDGTKIAYRHETTHDGDTLINVMNADGSGARTLREGISPAWSPDGKRIAFAGASSGPGTDIFVMNPDGSKVRRLTRTPYQIDEYPTWSRDGRKIMFASTRGVAYSGQSRALWIMTADGRNQRRLTGGWYDMYPAWSPRAGVVAFQSDRRTNRSGKQSIWTMTPNGRNLRQITRCNCVHPAWSSDGRFLAFMHPAGLAISTRKGNIVRVIARDLGETGFPAWRPQKP